MTRLNVTDARCAALFASALQRSDAPAAGELAEAISRTVRRFGIAGCASRMAQEFGDHPEAAATRMRWIRQLIAGKPAPSATPAAPAMPATPASAPAMPALRPAPPDARPPAHGRDRCAWSSAPGGPAADVLAVA